MFLSTRPPSFRDDLELVLPALPPALLAPSERPGLLALAQRLPRLDGGFELRLHDPAAQVELSLAAWPPVPEDLDRLAAGPDGWPDPGLMEGPVWQSLVATARRVLAEEGAERRSILWLEFDRPAMERPLPEPTLLLQAWMEPGASLLPTVGREHARLTGRPLGNGHAAQLEALAARMPPDTIFPSIGVMHGRPGTPLRLRLDHWPMADFALAAAVIWGEAETAPLRALLALHPDPATADAVTLDLREAGAPRFGLPLRGGVGAARHDEELGRLAALLDALVGSGLCTPGAAAALLAWPGHLPLPVLPGTTGLPVLLRVLLQLKLAWGAGGKIEAKAYVGLLRREVPQQGVPVNA